jgi:ABC-type transport system substrate-binding protein
LRKGEANDMASFLSFLTTKKIPSRNTFTTLMGGPLTTVTVLIYGLFFSIGTTIFILLVVTNDHFLVTVPARGGNLTEGVIGAAHFINPLMATTPTDKRLVALVYSSIEKTIDNYTVSPDGKIYTIALLPNLHFNDGTPLTSDDIAFTVQKMQNVMLSHDSEYWQSIAVENPDTKTVVFTLPTPDTTFLSHLHFSIMPKHIWQTIADESWTAAKQNLAPVGSGPFTVSKVIYQNGIPISIILRRNNYVVGGTAFLHTLTLDSFANQSDLLTAINNSDVDFSYSLTADTVKKISPAISVQAVQTDRGLNIYRSNADTALSNPSTIATLDQIIDKNALVATVLNGYGTPAGAPMNTSQKTVPAFSLAVENDPSVLLAAQTIAQQLQQHGVSISIKAYDPGIFQKSITVGTFSLFLARNTDVTIPSRYTVALPLYIESQPYVFTPAVHTVIPATLDSPAAEYQQVTDWYTTTDKLWKWLTPSTHTTN